MRFPWLSASNIDMRAEGLLTDAFGNDSHPLPIDLEDVVLHLSEAEQLSYVDDADLGFCDGEIVLGKTEPFQNRILLSASLKLDRSPGRARFTLAHEIGHWVLHRPILLDNVNQLSLLESATGDAFEFVGLNRTIFSCQQELLPTEEWQANRFATALLISKDDLRAEFCRRFLIPTVAWESDGWKSKSNSLRGHSRLLATRRCGKLETLNTLFGLSVEAMAVALEQRGYSTITECLF